MLGTPEQKVKTTKRTVRSRSYGGASNLRETNPPRSGAVEGAEASAGIGPALPLPCAYFIGVSATRKAEATRAIKVTASVRTHFRCDASAMKHFVEILSAIFTLQALARMGTVCNSAGLCVPATLRIAVGAVLPG